MLLKSLNTVQIIGHHESLFTKRVGTHVNILYLTGFYLKAIKGEV